MYPGRTHALPPQNEPALEFMRQQRPLPSPAAPCLFSTRTACHACTRGALRGAHVPAGHLRQTELLKGLLVEAD